MMLIKRVVLDFSFNIGTYVFMMALLFLPAIAPFYYGNESINFSSVFGIMAYFYFLFLYFHISHHFTKGLFNQNSYVLFSLPVSMRVLLLSKAICAMLKIYLSFAFFLYSDWILKMGKDTSLILLIKNELLQELMSLGVPGNLSPAILFTLLIVFISVILIFIINNLMFAGVFAQTVYQRFAKRIVKNIIFVGLLTVQILSIIYLPIFVKNRFELQGTEQYYIYGVFIIYPLMLFLLSAQMLNKRLEL